MSKKLVCPICGNPTRVYMGNARKDRLCAKHADELKAGKLILNDNGQYISTTKDNICIICGSKTPHEKYCNECNLKVREHINTINKNRNPHEIRDYYYNLKNYLYRVEGFEDMIKPNLTKMIALAELLKTVYKNGSLYEKVFDDIYDIVEKKKITILPQEIIENKNENIARIIRAEDGHFVDSDLEKDVDNILYNLRQVHCYGKKVNEILERSVKCDWFLPILSNSKGIYIELWGIEGNNKYDLNKEEKRKLYKKYQLPLIEIEKDELKGDTQGLVCRIESEIFRLKSELLKRNM
ncbi:MAG: hypothetical protein E7344_00025 [Clostridiales bacterium]|nr:hypothetical protein [Clostridiales bacterium]